MRVLTIHEHYRQAGGEDQAFARETTLLERSGCQVERLELDNADIDEQRGRLALALNSIWSVSSRRLVRDTIRRSKPDIVHVHNSFPLLSPAIYSAIRGEGLPVVQTLHNFRPLCLNAMLFRDGAPCQDCLTSTWKIKGVLRRCYRGSTAASAVVAALDGVHHSLGTWRRQVDLFLALSAFARDRYIAAGFPAERIVIQPNTADDPGEEAAAWDRPRRGALVVGRLSVEKGVLELVRSWRDMGHPLTVIGDGPLREQLAAATSDEVTLLGWQTPQQVSAAMAGAALLCLPSLCYEQFPLVAVEAMAHGLPILASNRGALSELVQPGQTGLLVEGDSWKTAAQSLLAAPAAYGQRSRAYYQENFHPDRAMAALLAHYQRLTQS